MLCHQAGTNSDSLLLFLLLLLPILAAFTTAKVKTSHYRLSMLRSRSRDRPRLRIRPRRLAGHYSVRYSISKLVEAKLRRLVHGSVVKTLRSHAKTLANFSQPSGRHVKSSRPRALVSSWCTSRSSPTPAFSIPAQPGRTIDMSTHVANNSTASGRAPRKRFPGAWSRQENLRGAPHNALERQPCDEHHLTRAESCMTQV